MPQLHYEPRLVLFLDILGFREVVEGTVESASAFNGVLHAIDAIAGMFKPEADGTKRATRFSDSIVVSYAISEESAVFWLVNDVALTIITLVERGFLLRGGVTIGELIHTDDYLVGPALIRAYEMESREAVYPRVIFDPDIIDIARQFHADQHSPEQEEQYTRTSYER